MYRVYTTISNYHFLFDYILYYNVFHLVVPRHKPLHNVEISLSPVLLENSSGQEIAPHFCVLGNGLLQRTTHPMWLR